MNRFRSMSGWLGVLGLALCLGGASAATSFEGRWEGAVQIDGAPMPIVLDLTPPLQPGAAWQGSVSLPGRGIKGVPLAAIQPRGAGLHFTLGAAFGVRAEAAPAITLRAAGGEGLVGEFEMAGLTAPLALMRSGAAQVDLPRANTPIGDALAGTWRGSYELGGYARQVTLILGRDTAEMTIVGKRTTNLAFDSIVQGARYLSLASNEFGVAVEGRWSEGTIDALFRQGPFEVPLTLKRDGAGSAR